MATHSPDVPVFRVAVLSGVEPGLVVTEGGQELGPLAAPVVEHLRLEKLEPHDREVDRPPELLAEVGFKARLSQLGSILMYVTTLLLNSSQ